MSSSGFFQADKDDDENLQKMYDACTLNIINFDHLLMYDKVPFTIMLLSKNA